MTYKFEQFTGTITDPTIAINHVSDNLVSKTCNVDIVLTTDSAEFGVTLTGFTYNSTWEDADIQKFVTVKMKEYETK